MALLFSTRNILPAVLTRNGACAPLQKGLAALSESSELGADKVVQKEERKTVKGQRKSMMKDHPEWSEDLATDSEAHVKADSDSMHDVKELQDHSVKIIAETHEEETTVEAQVEDSPKGSASQ